MSKILVLYKSKYGYEAVSSFDVPNMHKKHLS